MQLREGDEPLFRVEQSRAVIAKTPDFLELTGSVQVPAGKRGTPWDEVLRASRAHRGAGALSLFLDTNVLIRHLTGDPPGMAARATAALAARKQPPGRSSLAPSDTS